MLEMVVELFCVICCVWLVMSVLSFFLVFVVFKVRLNLMVFVFEKVCVLNESFFVLCIFMVWVSVCVMF